MINYARFLKVDAETALEKCNRKFLMRFQRMEEMAAQAGEKMADLDLTAMDRYWNRAKEAIKKEQQSKGTAS